MISIQQALLSATLLSAQSVLAQPADKSNYPAYVKAASGFDWEPYQVETEDGWLITVIRVTGKNGQRKFEKPEHAAKYPVYFHHGGGDSAIGWFDTFATGLLDEGYEVWLGNQRGNQYNQENVNDGVWSLKERWDFHWGTVGEFDVPAQIEKLLEVSGKDKVTLVGYSQGTSTLYYSLAKLQDWWADKAARYIAIASCLVNPGSVKYEETVQKYRLYDSLGYYNTDGGDASTADPSVVCELIADPKADCSGGAVNAQAVMNDFYWEQLSVAGRLQERQTLEKWIDGEIYTEPVSLTNIDRVPVTLIAPQDDTTCPQDMAEWYYAEIQSPDTFYEPVIGGHVFWILPKYKASFWVNWIERGSLAAGSVSLVEQMMGLTTLAIMVSATV